MKRNLRILIVSAAYRPYPSGVSEHTHNLAVNLHKLGHKVTILTTNFPEFEHLVCEETEGIPVYRFGRALLIPLNRSYATLPTGIKLPFQVAKFLRCHNFDIVHCHGVFWPEISYWALRYSQSINLITFLTAGFRLYRRGGKIFQLIFCKEIKKIHGKIAISQRAQAAIEPYIPGEYRIIPSGVDLNHFHPGVPPLPEKNQNPRILFLGRLDKRKGIEILLQALPLVQKTIPNVQLIVVGAGVMEKRCRQIVEKLKLTDAVHFVGAVSRKDLPRYYRGCDVYCSPALGGETQGVVLIEAMACGTPVVASDIPGYRETIQNGVDGLLFPPGDVKTLSNIIIQVILNNELRNKLVRGGLHKVKNYDWLRIARQTLDYYYELLEKNCQSVSQ